MSFWLKRGLFHMLINKVICTFTRQLQNWKKNRIKFKTVQVRVNKCLIKEIPHLKVVLTDKKYTSFELELKEVVVVFQFS